MIWSFQTVLLTQEEVILGDASVAEGTVFDTMAIFNSTCYFNVQFSELVQRNNDRKMPSLKPVISAILKCFRQYFFPPKIVNILHLDFVSSHELSSVVEAILF